MLRSGERLKYHIMIFAGECAKSGYEVFGAEITNGAA